MNFAHLLTDTYAIVLMAAALVTFVYLAVYYGLTFMRVGLRAKKLAAASGGDDEAVEMAEDGVSTSVVLVVHNDSELMRQHIPSVLVQNVKDYQVVIVDYMSVDDTNFVLQICSKDYPNLNCVRIRDDVNFFKGKKYPLSMGIRSAKGEAVVLTQPDCEPVDFTWAQKMTEAFADEKIQIVLGYTRLRTKKNLLGWLEQYYNMDYNCKMLSSAMMGHPYTGMGSNLAHRRQFFFDKDGFINHYIEPCGADDIFVNRNATKTNTAVCLDPKAAVVADGAFSFFTWRYMRKQTYSTRCYYSLWQRLRLVLRPIMVVLFYVICGLMFALPSVPWIIPAVLLLLKMAWQVVCVGCVQPMFAIRNYHWFAPLMEIYFVFSNTFLSIISLHPKRCNP